MLNIYDLNKIYHIINTLKADIKMLQFLSYQYKGSHIYNILFIKCTIIKM